jgi:pyruvate kinase
LERPCRVLMDLAGPKLRTTSIEPGPQVVKWRPERNAFGRVVAPARIWLTPAAVSAAPPVPADACVPLVNDWATHLRTGDKISFVDARGKKRVLRIVAEAAEGRWAESDETAYLTPGTVFKLKHRGGVDVAATNLDEGRVAALPQTEQTILLRPGDVLVLTDGSRQGTPALYDADGELVRPPMIGCNLPSVFQQLIHGDRVLFDDGRIAGVVVAADDDQVQVKITRAREKGEKLGANKGINLPDSTLHLPALTPKDLSDLDAVVRLADIVGYSSVRRAEDVDLLRAELAKRKAEHLGVVLKIENKQAFDHLPSLLLAAMQNPLVGVMIARGDLAVECGYERLAEVQEELLWMCEAAHLPVIWATQVLESLAKQGLPSRAEITDAAMSERAECVMLNKGPFITEALALLDDILRRMAGHQHKKRPMLRRLEVAHRAASPR